MGITICNVHIKFTVLLLKYSGFLIGAKYLVRE